MLDTIIESKELIESNQLATELKRIKKEVFDLLGYHIDEEILRSLILDWLNSEELIKKSFPFRKEILDKYITREEDMLMHLKKYTKKRNLYSYISKSLPLHNHIHINELTAEHFQHQKNIDYLNFWKSSTNKKEQKLHTMYWLFKSVEKIGLKNNGRVGNGQGNKNELLHFVAIITGMHYDSVNRYYKESKEYITPA